MNTDRRSRAREHPSGQGEGPSPAKQVVAALILRGATPSGATPATAVAPVEVLICQRSMRQAMPLQWEFPGGKIEPGELPEAALRRELNEELGIDAEIGRQVASLRHNYKNGGTVELRFFVVQRYAGEIQNIIFHDVRWEKLAKLPQYEFLHADRTLVRDLAAGKLL